MIIFLNIPAHKLKLTMNQDALWSALPLVTCVGGCLTYQNGEKEGAKSVNINDFPYEEKGFSLYDEYGDLMGARVAASLLFHLGVTQTIARFFFLFFVFFLFFCFFCFFVFLFCFLVCFLFVREGEKKSNCFHTFVYLLLLLINNNNCY